MFHFYSQEKRAPKPAYQIALKITGYTLSLYLNKAFNQGCNSFQTNQPTESQLSSATG